MGYNQIENQTETWSAKETSKDKAVKLRLVRFKICLRHGWRIFPSFLHVDWDIRRFKDSMRTPDFPVQYHALYYYYYAPCVGNQSV